MASFWLGSISRIDDQIRIVYGIGKKLRGREDKRGIICLYIPRRISRLEQSFMLRFLGLLGTTLKQDGAHEEQAPWHLLKVTSFVVSSGARSSKMT
jgi:hypothetical protein